ncbi:predicted protein [Botrytis cinerea T4]|uniref:Uncharacterized protein n=1 Tax=Botryotinia fuckeliana (strain T4) TaxID=999810 RepID=G2XW34_BOTF4|nr:predicted protein [Botrytis cinerea T4]
MTYGNYATYNSKDDRPLLVSAGARLEDGGVRDKGWDDDMIQGFPSAHLNGDESNI